MARKPFKGEGMKFAGRCRCCRRRMNLSYPDQVRYCAGCLKKARSWNAKYRNACRKEAAALIERAKTKARSEAATDFGFWNSHAIVYIDRIDPKRMSASEVELLLDYLGEDVA